MIFDTHCHLDATNELEAVLVRARQAGVAALIDVGIDLASSRSSIARSQTRRNVFASAGLHPNDCADYATEMDQVAVLCAQPEVVAVGETGLDYYWDKVPADVQRASLEAHLILAAKIDKPIILHCRDAFTDLFSVLQQHAPVRGVLHCFSGTTVEARRGLDLGLFVSFAGPVTYPKNDALRQAASFVPIDRLLVETDAPFLPPQGMRGQTNEPAYITVTVAAIADQRGETLAAVAEQTFANALQLFFGGDGGSVDIDGGLGNELTS